MSDQPDTNPDSAEKSGPTPDSNADEIQRLVDRVSNNAFNEWYAEHQFETNILEGKAYFNGPTPAKEPEQHTPNKLLRCHRKANYDRQNAPREGTPPEGLFWIGSAFEEEIIVPFLQDIVPTDLYVQNSLWLDTTIEAGDHEVRLRGSTDPAIVTEDADPVFLTEIKTTSSLDYFSEPKQHHKAQIHAYLYALNQERESSITDGLLVYGSRKTLDIKVFPVTFDPAFWETVVTWMQQQTEYDEHNELPPADPEREWECSYCSFRHRCGQTDSPYSHIGSTGFLPLFDGYDRKNVVEYLESHSDTGAKLTPVLAQTFPDLVERYGAYEWSCPGCSGTWTWDAVDWGGDPANPPLCPACATEDKLVTLSGPEPNDQHGK